MAFRVNILGIDGGSIKHLVGQNWEEGLRISIEIEIAYSPFVQLLVLKMLSQFVSVE